MTGARDKDEGGDRYEVTVWDMVRGDIIKKLWDATWAEAEGVRDWYADDIGIEVVVEEKP
jgi:hypothetical protein